MVRKLLKYEWAHFIKTILPMELILLGIALLTRFVQFFEADTTVYKIISVSSIVIFCIACAVCIIMTFVININRFYRNLYSPEGYLSFTLPVTVDQHIFAKLTTAVLTTLLSAVSVIAAVAVTTAGDVLTELLKAAGYLFGRIVDLAGWQTLIIALELILLIAAIIASGYLLFYACATLGQTAKKRRVLAAFGFYFLYYVIKQAFGTFFIIVFSIVSETDWFVKVVDWVFDAFRNHPFISIHISIWIAMLFTALLGCVYYLINRFVMKNKLNLE